MRSVLLGAAATATALVVSMSPATPASPGSPAAPSASREVTGAWASGTTSAVAGGVLTGSATPGGPGRFTVTLTNAVFEAIPTRCFASNTIHRRSFLDASHHRLVCRTRSAGEVRFEARPDVAAAGSTVSARIEADDRSVDLPDLTIAYADPAAPADPPGDAPGDAPAAIAPGPRSLRILSSPDFLNADVGDLRRGPGSWDPRRSGNSINRDYRRALDRVLDDWRSTEPDDVLVAGDLVEGWWGRESDRSGNFGPVDTYRHRRQALKRAAATYYPQWRKRFEQRGLDVHPAMGDHEFGDNPWPRDKRRMASAFEAAFTRHLTRKADGSPSYDDRPVGSRHEFSAYAWRPTPDVQMITLNVFDVTDKRMRIRLDRIQMRWLVGVLRQARADGVPWVIAQGHTPIIGPVHQRGSSGLSYSGGSRSRLWTVFKRYGVDLYLCGEVHDVTATQRDGVLQLTHGGLFQYGLTNYLLADVYADHISLDLRDYDMSASNSGRGSRLWETKPGGLPKNLRVDPTPVTIGTGTLHADGTLDDLGGVLLPFEPR